MPRSTRIPRRLRVICATTPLIARTPSTPTDCAPITSASTKTSSALYAATARKSKETLFCIWLSTIDLFAMSFAKQLPHRHYTMALISRTRSAAAKKLSSGGGRAESVSHLWKLSSALATSPMPAMTIDRARTNLSSEGGGFVVVTITN